MANYENTIGVKVPDLLLPREGVSLEKWAVVACDQFTSQPEYWEETERITDNQPSTYRIMLPELYLGKPDENERIADIRSNMERYMSDGVLESKGEGFALVKRQCMGKTRLGLVMALDLEDYDYKKGSTTLIRASEGTIVDRIPPRLRIRLGAPLEMPHILVLIDDPKRTVIEPLMEISATLPKLYDFDLMQGGGHIEGYLVSKPALIDGVLGALESIKNDFAQKYDGREPMLFAMGDGNHSFATAKANWENIKAGLTAKEQENNPARYALVEVENVHDEGIVFEPIHRVVFGVDTAKVLPWLTKKLSDTNNGCEFVKFESFEAAKSAALKEPKSSHIIPTAFEGGCGYFKIEKPIAQLAVGTLQNELDKLLKEFSGTSIDYIHGEDVVLELGQKSGNMGFFLPPMEKSAFFDTVVFDGALPRKTFSMGEAQEKRYYLECRQIIGD